MAETTNGGPGRRPAPLLPTVEQRRMVGNLILLGNRRRELFMQAALTEQQLHAAVLEAFRDHQIPKNVIARSASLSRQTIYNWLADAGLHTPGLEAEPSEIPEEGADA